MRLIGCCEKCHKIKEVRVIEREQMLRVTKVPFGICKSCEDEQ